MKRFALKKYRGVPGVNALVLDPSAISKQTDMLNHSNVVRQISTWVSKQDTYILFPMGDMNLRQFLTNEQPPSKPADQLKILEQLYSITSAVNFLHAHHSDQALKNQFTRKQRASLAGSHLDIKPENIIMRKDNGASYTWQIADFGISNSHEDSYSIPDIFLPPELEGQFPNDIGRQQDVWALGCVFLEVILWMLGPEVESQRQTMAKLGQLWQSTSDNQTIELKPGVVSALAEFRQTRTSIPFLENVVELIRSALEVDHRQRIHVSELLRRLESTLNQASSFSSLDWIETEDDESEETDITYDSDRSSTTSDSFSDAGPQTPDTIYSADGYVEIQVDARWQTRRMYPFLLHGLEPEPIHDKILNTLAKRFDTMPMLKSQASSAKLKPSSADLGRAILRSLSFPEMEAREQAISSNHKGTFEWLIEDNGWKSWLENTSQATSCFWIQGKPGSGKSTLMKYLAQHYQNSRAYQVDASPITLTYFFSYGGTVLQRSHVGFIRSLLHQIISKRTELFSYLSSSFGNKAADYPASFLRALPEAWHNWSLVELRELLDEVLRWLQPRGRILILIDGLDECRDEDLEDVLAHIQKLSLTPNFKLCLASRPWTIIMESLRSSPGLRLQDLTKKDIELYVKSRLDRMLNDEIETSADADLLRAPLVNKAQGVFLWLRLVIDKLEKELLKGASISELLEHSNVLPAGVGELYERILSDIKPEYHIEASMAFQIVNRSKKPFPLFAMDFALSEQAWPTEHAAIHLLETKWARRIMSRTAGFLTVEQTVNSK